MTTLVNELSIPNLDAATNDPDELVHLATALSVLAAYADCKAIAMRFRLRGEIDLALVTPESTLPELHARRLFDERYVCVMRANHPDAQGGALSLDRFCELDHALVSYIGGSFKGVTDEALARLGRERRVTVSVTSFLVLPRILKSSDLIAVVPYRLVARSRGLVAIEPPLEIPGFTKTASWHERTHRSPAHRWVRELLFKTCAALT